MSEIDRDTKAIIKITEDHIKQSESENTNLISIVKTSVDSRVLQKNLIEVINAEFKSHIGDLENLINGWKCELENNK